MAVGETARMFAELGWKDNLTPGVNKAIGSVNRLQSKLGSSFNKGVSSAARNTERIVVGGALAAGAAFAATTKIVANFGDEMNTINTIAQVTPAELSKIGDGIRGLARDTGADLSDLTSSYYDLLSAGIKVTDAQNALNLSYKLSRGALSTTGEAVDFLTTAINAYKLNARQTTVASDEFAQAVADGKVKLSDIAASFSNVASVAKNAGIGLNQIAASYGFLTAQGVDAAEVTTEMNRAIIELLKPNKNLLELQDKLGVSFAKMAKTKGLVPTLEAMRVAAAKAGIPFQDLFGRLEGYRFALQTTGPAFKAFMAEQDRINQSAGALNKQYDERQQGLNYQLQRLKANALDAAISVGQGFAPALGRLADKATAFIGDHRTELVQFGKDIGAALDSIDWDKVERVAGAIGDSLKVAASASKVLLDSFLALPDWVKTAVITGWGLNKFTGGALGDIVGELGKGLIKGVLGMNAAVVNINAGVVNGGGPSVNGVINDVEQNATKGGIIASLLRFLPVAGVSAGAFLGGGTIETSLIDTLKNSLPGAMGQAVGDALQAHKALFFPGFDTVTHLDQLPGQIADAISGKADAAAAAQSAGLGITPDFRARHDIGPALTSGLKDLFGRLKTALSPAVIALARYNKELRDREHGLRKERKTLTPGSEKSALIAARLKGIDEKERITNKGIADLAKGANPTLSKISTKLALNAARLASLTQRLHIAREAKDSARAARLSDRIKTVKQSTDQLKQRQAAELAKTDRHVDQAKSGITSAQRTAASGVERAMEAAASRIVSAVFQARPVIQSTNVTRSTTVIERAGPTGGSGNTPRTPGGAIGG